ncbi:MAG: aminodeoxychorismate/anthranilate synthase component II [Pseudomonadota bacterium]
MPQHFEGRPGAPRLLVLDNYDSFTFNLVQGFAGLGAEVLVYRNDEIDTAAALGLEPTHVVISPGPGRPADAGVSLAMVAAFAGLAPLLGVCLGHQSIVEHFGGRIVRAARLMHGKTSAVRHDGRTLFAGIDNPMDVGRYHSLCAEVGELPGCFEVSATTADGELMAVRHRELAVEGVQFHPESVLTPHGLALMENFLTMGSAA